MNAPDAPQDRDLVEATAVAMLRIEMAPTIEAARSDAIIEAADRHWRHYTEYMRDRYRERARALLAEIVPLVSAGNAR